MRVMKGEVWAGGSRHPTTVRKVDERREVVKYPQDSIAGGSIWSIYLPWLKGA